MLTKSRLNNKQASISKALIDSNIIHDGFVLISNVLKEFYDMKEDIKNPNDKETIYKTMLSYCLKCRKNAESKNPKFVRTENRRIMLLSKCEVGNSKKLIFIKEEKASGLSNSLRKRRLSIKLLY